MSNEPIRQRVVLLIGSANDAAESASLASESSRLAMLLDSATGPVDVSVISLGLSRTITGLAEHIRLDESGRSAADGLLTAVGAFALRAFLASYPAGRLLNSLGPVDPSRVFWRAVKQQPAAMRCLASANVVIATDAATTKTAWLAVHRGWVDDAYLDHRSASVGLGWQLPAVEKPSRE